MSFIKASEAACRWFADRGQGDDTSTRRYLVSNALGDYLAGFAGKYLENNRRRIEAIIRPQIGGLDTSKLTAKGITD